MSSSGSPGRSPRGGLTRRRLLGLGLATGAGALPVVATGCGAAAGSPSAPLPVVPFRGTHQAGIATPAQDRLVFAALDLATDRAAEVRDMLRTWTAAAERMTQGRPVRGDAPSPLSPPADTGEAEGLSPASLTVTFGVGPSLFDRLGIAARRPGALSDLPALPGDELDPRRGGGDLCLQACADDPQVAFHAVRNLVRLGRGVVVLRWSQLGFGRTSSTSSAQATPRNLMGFKDGTNNITAEDGAAMDGHVWVGGGADPAWMRGGTYLVARRIRMLIETWDRAGLDDQERTIGRRKASGAPLTGAAEHDPPRLDRKDADGEPVIPAGAHIRLAAAATNGGARILRRGYSYTDGMDPATGELDAGLFFICFQRDARAGFIPIQRRLGLGDGLNEYIRHTGSAVFACPGGVGPHGSWGDGLLD